MKLPSDVRRHHTLYTKASQNSQTPTKALRAVHELIPPMYDEPHAQLHSEIPTIPLLDHVSAQLVLNKFEPIRNNYLRSINQLITVVDEVTTSYKSSIIQREIGATVIHALELQIPFIKDGLYT